MQVCLDGSIASKHCCCDLYFFVWYLIFYGLNVCIFLSDGSIVGAVGVSGASAAEDEYLAWKGIQALFPGKASDAHLAKLLENIKV